MTEDSNPLARSCLVVAHPDDEILWFSSILEKVEQVIFCFHASPSFTKISRGRETLLKHYPLTTLRSLEVEEAPVFDKAHWPDPQINEYGLSIPSRRHSDAASRYQDNFLKLQRTLEKALGEFKNVYTHNPWGEYGHEEHVQVFRAVDACRLKIGFDMWCSGYVGTRSHNLMAQQAHRISSIFHTRPTDSALQRRLYERYVENSAWTWEDDMSGWFPQESTFRVANENTDRQNPRYIPVNYIDMTAPIGHWADRSLRSLTRSFMGRLFKHRI